MLHDPSPSLTALRTRLAGHALDLAAMRLQVLIKANFNPAQLRTPAGHTGGGRWTREGGGVQLWRIIDRRCAVSIRTARTTKIQMLDDHSISGGNSRQTRSLKV